MAQRILTTASPTRLAALAVLGPLLITACGNEPDEVNATVPDSSSPSAPEEEGEQAPSEEGADVSLVIERSLSDDESLSPEPGYEEGTWTLTCAPVGGDHPAPEAACAEIEEVGTSMFLLDTSDMTCTMQMGGPEVVTVTGHIDGTEIDTEFNKVGGCEIDRFETVNTVLNP